MSFDNQALISSDKLSISLGMLLRYFFECSWEELVLISFGFFFKHLHLYSWGKGADIVFIDKNLIPVRSSFRASSCSVGNDTLLFFFFCRVLDLFVLHMHRKKKKEQEEQT